jgi:hypothetical protein
VFVTRNGTCHYSTNIHGRLRHIRLLDDYAGLTVLQGVTPHSFRRTVATEIDEVYDAEATKNQLGHTSTTMTERHYINRKLVVPDYRAATERLAPRFWSGPRDWTGQVGPATPAADLLPLREAALSVLRDRDWHRKPTGALRARLRAILRTPTPTPDARGFPNAECPGPDGR